MVKMIAFFALLSPSLVGAAQDYILNTHQRLEAKIAGKDLTRIAVQGDRIQQVFGGEDEFALETDEQSGQIFLKPRESTLTKPVNLTLVTESGLTQDLKLLPGVEEAESILLHVKPSSPETLSSSTPRVKELLKVIKAVGGEEMPEGYHPEPCPAVTREFPVFLKAEPRRCFQGVYAVEAYKITNISAHPQVLNERSLAKPGDIAVALGAPELKVQMATLVIFIQPLPRN